MKPILSIKEAIALTIIIFFIFFKSWQRLIVGQFKYRIRQRQVQGTKGSRKSKTQVVAKYGILKNVLSTWLKIKDKIF